MKDYEDPLASYFAEGGQVNFGFRLTPEALAAKKAEEEAAKIPDMIEEIPVPMEETTTNNVPNNNPNYSSGDMSQWKSEDWNRWLVEQGMVGGTSNPYAFNWGASIANYQAPSNISNFNMDSEGIAYNNTFDENSYGIPNYQGSIPQTTANTSVAYNPQQVVSSGANINNRVSFGNIDGNNSFYLNKDR